MNNELELQRIEIGNLPKDFVDDNNILSNIKIFKETLEDRFDETIMSNFYNNLNTLVVRVIAHSNDCFGMYDPLKNEIIVCEDSLETSIWHELMHMASRYCALDEGIISSGFSRICDDNSIGYGITEGYTDLLSQRYFNRDIFYDKEVKIVSLLEEIVGKDIMEKYYLEADFSNFLLYFDDTLEFFNFICDVDFINSDEGNITEALRRAGEFLLKCIFNKSFEDDLTDIISFVNKLDKFNILNNSQSKDILNRLCIERTSKIFNEHSFTKKM